MAKRAFGDVYRGEFLDRVAFPMGGIGAGMICLEGCGALSHVSLRHHPDVHHEPPFFASLHVAGGPTARVLEGPVPKWKIFGKAGPNRMSTPGNGLSGRTYGLPRFGNAEFDARFPFATVHLSDASMPVTVDLTGWSPFLPNEADESSLPVAALEYRFTNPTDEPAECVFSSHMPNFMQWGPDGAIVREVSGGFVVGQQPVPDEPWKEGFLSVTTDDPSAIVDAAWFRGGWRDTMTMNWNAVATGKVHDRRPHADGAPGGGASLYVPFVLQPGEERTIRVRLAWYVPKSNVHAGTAPSCEDGCQCRSEAPYGTHVPWYAARFDDIDAITAYWATAYDRLRAESKAFADCFYDTTFPAEVVEAVAANLTILKSPTVLRQADGRLWAWEGCCDGSGCCHGSCTHVWNYAQALPHLFPALERTFRETEFLVSQDARGHQNFRSTLPIGPVDHGFHAAADGQLGGLIKLHREWRISGDGQWLAKLWPAAKRSLDYCIETWDPDHTGRLVEPHHNTYDIEFWGPDGMCTSFYIAALAAAVAMGRALGDDVDLYEQIAEKGRKAMADELFDGEYFVQKVQWEGLRAGSPLEAEGLGLNYTPEAQDLLRREGPKYQYGLGCLSDGVLGDWLARCSGVATGIDEDKIASHLAAVFRHNFREHLRDHANPQRPSYALGDDGGLLLCSWPKSERLSIPFPYSDEVWTGIEYQVASHLIMFGRPEEALAIVRSLRQRHDGYLRNPFNEYECGHWYARAMSSYGLLQALGGVRYDAVTKTLHLEPAVDGDFRAFLSTATGYGTVGLKDGEPFVEVVRGEIDIETIEPTSFQQPV